MALHRDIFWIGRQWAVTGFGMQAINQKYGGQFDIAADRLWDDDLLDVLREQTWFNAEDFAKGLAVARVRHPQPPGKPLPLPIETLLQTRGVIAPVAVVPSPKVVPDAPNIAATEMIEPAKPALALPHLRLFGHPAKFLRVWRVRRRH